MSALAKYLTLTLVIGSAFNAADAKQRARLKAELQPNLDQLRNAGRDEHLFVKNAIIGLMTTVREVMGEEWEPDEKTKEYIRQLSS